jgi:hypothetical protein
MRDDVQRHQHAGSLRCFQPVVGFLISGSRRQAKTLAKTKCAGVWQARAPQRGQSRCSRDCITGGTVGPLYAEQQGYRRASKRARASPEHPRPNCPQARAPPAHPERLRGRGRAKRQRQGSKPFNVPQRAASAVFRGQGSKPFNVPQRAASAVFRGLAHLVASFPTRARVEAPDPTQSGCRILPLLRVSKEIGWLGVIPWLPS